MEMGAVRSTSFWSPQRVILAGGAALLAVAAVVGTCSQKLWAWAWVSSSGLYLVVTLGVMAGAIYLLAVGDLRRSGGGKRWNFVWIVAIGLVMRLMLLHCAPGRGSDSFRYMWDGALSAHGLNPYLYTPDDGKRALADAHADPQLKAIARAAGVHLDWINHPDVKSIYPPVAQAAFLIAHWMRPWSGLTWRIVLLMFDLATLGLLVLLLRRVHLPPTWLGIYWWNPLLISEFYCAGHLDVVVLPFVVGSLLLAIKQRPSLSMLILAGAVGAKFWPVVLLPLLLRPTLRQPRRLFIALVSFAIMTAALLLPMLLAGRSGIAGIETYARAWQSNDGLFRLNVLFWQHALPIIAQPAWAAQAVARWMAAIILLASVLWLARKPLLDPLDLCESCLLAVAVLFLLSPTQFPWYYTWMVPLLAVRPRWSLLAYTALLPLYYLYYMRFSQGPWVWVEHIPVWLLLTLECLSRFRRFELTHPVPSRSHDSIIVSTSSY